jgi:hypothetical protein
MPVDESVGTTGELALEERRRVRVSGLCRVLLGESPFYERVSR